MTASAESVEDIPLFPPRGTRTLCDRFFRLPGVYRPQADSHLLAGAIREARIPEGASVLDLCCGTGAQAVTAAREGAGSVTAIDVSTRALVSAWVNGTSRRLPVRVRRGDMLTAAGQGPFDVVVANPPYVPSAASPRRASRGWDAGEDGRAVLDPLCVTAPALLRSGGFMLLVHSAVSGVDRSLDRFRAAGLKASVVARARVPFGPVLLERVDFLEARGLIEPGERTEELVVIRADRTEKRC